MKCTFQGVKPEPMLFTPKIDNHYNLWAKLYNRGIIIQYLTIFIISVTHTWKRQIDYTIKIGLIYSNVIKFPVSSLLGSFNYSSLVEAYVCHRPHAPPPYTNNKNEHKEVNCISVCNRYFIWKVHTFVGPVGGINYTCYKK